MIKRWAERVGFFLNAISWRTTNTLNATADPDRSYHKTTVYRLSSTNVHIGQTIKTPIYFQTEVTSDVER